jgi:putative ABC transport system permease protein
MTDFQLALRSLRRSPGFTALVVGTLALGIGINTAIFSVVNGVLLKPLPYDEPERVMTLWEANPQLDVAQDQVSAGTYRDWAEQASSFESIGAYNVASFIGSTATEPEQIRAARISPSVLDVVAVRPALGRPFQEDEATPGNDQVMLVSNAFWRERLGGEERVLGTTVYLDTTPYEVVGVMPPGFEFPPGADDVQVWIPLAINARLFDVRAMRVYNVVGRLGADASLARARSELEGISTGIAEEHPETNRGWGAQVTPALEQVVGDVRTLVAVLAAAAALVLLIGCVNVANLVLARASVGQREFAIRAALGAGRGSLLRRSLAESLTLALGGGLTGLALALGGVALLRRVLPPDLPRVDEVAVDGRVLAFALLASIASGVVFGLYPALRAMRPRLLDVLQDAGRGRSGGRMATRMLNGLVAGQVATALVLLLGAGVVIRSISRLLEVDPGFRTEGIVTAALVPPESWFPDRGSQVQFWNDMVDAVAALPGVEAAGAVSALPMSPVGTDFDLPIRLLGREAPSIAEQPRAAYRAVIPGYFEAMEIPLVRGRLLDRFDREQGRPVMVLNESAERLLFPGEEALGQILGVPMAGTIEVVGIVADVRHDGLDAPVAPEIFVAFQNFPTRDMHVVVSLREESPDAVAAVREEVTRVANGIPLTRFATMEQLVSESVARPRFNVVLLLGFALCALVLATVGIYGVISYAVTQRTGEIGLRMALGSDASHTFRLVVGQTGVYVLAGGVLGVAASVLASGAIRGLLYEVSPLDPLTLVGVVLVLSAAALAAAAAPALRATRIPPVQALQGD